MEPRNIISIGEVDELVNSEDNINFGENGEPEGAPPGSVSQACIPIFIRQLGRP